MANVKAVHIRNENAPSAVVVVCEHASAFVPDHLNDLGLKEADRTSHAAWDPGALAVAEGLADALNAKLVFSGVSRLVYDCNRPPTAPDAMPAQSERITVPGNAALTDADRQDRVDRYYRPFEKALRDQIAATPDPVIVTIHSFTPVYHGKPRHVEIGILHDSDTRLADAMLDHAAAHTTAIVERNAPYGPTDGVTHTLQEHALPQGHLNVMIEIRNDLIASQSDQSAMAQTLARWIIAALDDLGQTEDVSCEA